jgi:2Fe-2S ferredoxin
MPTIVFEPPNGPAKSIDAPTGGSLADLCDAHDAPVPFSCRSASCGTCRCAVVEGADLLSAPEDEELDILDMFNSPKNHRLACCAKVKGGAGKVHLKPVNDF